MKINRTLQERIFENWERKFQKGVNWFDSEERELVSQDGRFKFLAVFNKSKERYYKSGAAKADSEDVSPFTKTLEEKDKYVSYEHLIIRPTFTPLFFGHVIIITEEVRPEIRTKDFLVLHYLSTHTDYTIVVNLRKSGASVPSHFHAQGQLLEYPVTSPEHGARFERVQSDKKVHIDRLVYPAYGLRLKTDDTTKLNKLGAYLEMCQLGYPFNLLIQNGDVFIYPRTKESSPCLGNWLIASQEMGGLFCAKTKENLYGLDYMTCERALRETTYSGRKQQRQFEESIRRALNG